MPKADRKKAVLPSGWDCLLDFLAAFVSTGPLNSDHMESAALGVRFLGTIRRLGR